MSQPKPAIDLGYPTEPHGRFPSFANVEEEAAFWDTHDFTDFLEESVSVQITVGQALAERRARVYAIVKDLQAQFKASGLPHIDHGELLYDENGVPREGELSEAELRWYFPERYTSPERTDEE